MKITLISTLFILILQSAQAKPIAPMDFSETIMLSSDDRSEDTQSFEAIVALSNCSGAVVKFEGQSDDAMALVMTNDHCIFDQADGEFQYNKKYERSVNIFNKDKLIIDGQFYSTRIVYATQTDTDLALLEINTTYSELSEFYDVEPLTLDPIGAVPGDSISVISGFWRKEYNCEIIDIVYKLQESTWFWSESYGYDCDTIGGTSGSPIVLTDTRVVIGINNTSNEKGKRCTLNNPCEIDPEGNVSVVKGKAYGQQTKYLYTCLNESVEFDLETPGCKMLGGDSWGLSFY